MVLLLLRSTSLASCSRRSRCHEPPSKRHRPPPACDDRAGACSRPGCRPSDTERMFETAGLSPRDRAAPSGSAGVRATHPLPHFDDAPDFVWSGYKGVELGHRARQREVMTHLFAGREAYPGYPTVGAPGLVTTGRQHESSPMAASIRYATADDGARIAYSVQGTGPTLVECNGFWNSFGNENPWSRDAWAAVRTHRTLIRFDARGIGLSERDPPAISHELMVSDLECVVDAADARQFALWGGGVSVPSAIAFAVRHPNRVERLVLTRGVVRAADIMPRDNLVSLLGLIRTDWELASRLFADFETREDTPDYGVPVTAEIKRNISASTATRWLQGLYDSTDVTDIVPQVQAPTLVLHRIEDSLFPFAGAQEMAARIPYRAACRPARQEPSVSRRRRPASRRCNRGVPERGRLHTTTYDTTTFEAGSASRGHTGHGALHRHRRPHGDDAAPRRRRRAATCCASTSASRANC